MGVRRQIALLSILLLIGTASAVPLLPAEFWGSVTIDGSPASVGTVITARIGDRDCGSLTLEKVGVYGGNGIFDRRLLVSGEEGDSGKTITFTINGKPAGTAVYTPGTSTHLDLATTSGVDFSATITSGVAPFTVRFTGESTGSVTSWSWTFGDGGTSTVRNPTYVYAAPGNYTVRLSVDGGKMICTKPNYIKVTPILFGDAYEDGKVNQVDTLHVLKQVVGLESKPGSSTKQFQKTDVNYNGVIDVGDAMFIAQYNVGLRDVWFELLE